MFLKGEDFFDDYVKCLGPIGHLWRNKILIENSVSKKILKRGL